MTDSNTSSSFGQAATYQSIIIALVAGGILSTGIISIIYRRRRRRRLIRELPSGMRLVITSDGRIATVPRGGLGGRKGKLDIGKEPILWDFGLGNLGEIEDENEKVEGIGEEEEFKKRRKGKDKLEPGVSGVFGDDWNPISVSLPSFEEASKPIPAVEMTILIAMPDPSHPLSSSSSKSSSSTLPLQESPHLEDYPIAYQPDWEAEDLPILEFATTVIPIQADENEITGILDRLRPSVDALSPENDSSDQIRVERVDGFRHG